MDSDANVSSPPRVSSPLDTTDVTDAVHDYSGSMADYQGLPSSSASRRSYMGRADLTSYPCIATTMRFTRNTRDTFHNVLAYSMLLDRVRRMGPMYLTSNSCYQEWFNMWNAEPELPSCELPIPSPDTTGAATTREASEHSSDEDSISERNLPFTRAVLPEPPPYSAHRYNTEVVMNPFDDRWPYEDDDCYDEPAIFGFAAAVRKDTSQVFTVLGVLFCVIVSVVFSVMIHK